MIRFGFGWERDWETNGFTCARLFVSLYVTKGTSSWDLALPSQMP
jgi:hypothetical protein